MSYLLIVAYRRAKVIGEDIQGFAIGCQQPGRAHQLNDDATNPQSSASGGYVSFVAHIWVEASGKIIRGTIEDAHTGTRLAFDLSEVVAFLQASLAHSPGQVWNPQNDREEDRNEE